MIVLWMTNCTADLTCITTPSRLALPNYGLALALCSAVTCGYCLDRPQSSRTDSGVLQPSLPMRCRPQSCLIVDSRLLRALTRSHASSRYLSLHWLLLKQMIIYSYYVMGDSIYCISFPKPVLQLDIYYILFFQKIDLKPPNSIFVSKPI